MNRYIHTLLLLATLATTNLYAQTKTWYQQRWAEVDSLARELGRPRSALEVVKKIDAAARRQQNATQRVLALHFQTLLEERIDPDTLPHAIRYLEREAKTLSGPAAALTRNLLVQRYLTYYNRHSVQFYRNIAKETKPAALRPLDTWSYADLHARITTLLRASLQPAAELQRTPSEAYAPLLSEGDYRFRPTLYDVLAASALEYFASDEYRLNQPDGEFDQQVQQLFLPAAKFVGVHFTGKDSNNRAFQAALLYQQLLRRQLPSADKLPLIETDAARVAFARRFATSEEYDSLYRAALEEQAARYGNRAHSALVQLARACLRDANTYSPLKDTTMRWQRLKALDLLRRVEADSQRRDVTWGEARSLLEEQLLPRIDLEHELVNLPGQPARMLLGYRNLRRLYFYVLPAASAYRSVQPRFDSLNYAAAVARWEVLVPPTGDSQLHHVEVKIDPLPAGSYLLVALNTPYYEKGSSLTVSSYQTSTIACVLNTPDMLVLHRETGEPLQASVTFHPPAYSKDPAKGPYQTDAQGHLVLPDSVQHFLYNNYASSIELTANGETLRLSEPVNFQYRQGRDYDADEEDYLDPTELADNEKAFFFLDRSIYRPGQTVQFKAVVVRKQPLPAPAVGRKLWIYLENPYNDEIDSLLLTTNEYGTLRGSFRLPQGGLTGSFQLKAGGDYNSLQRLEVEEYKRPRFAVTFEKPEHVARPGDSTSVRGTALSFAGNRIAGATVAYTIKRSVSDPRPYDFRRSFSNEFETLIAEGKVQTDAEGRFVIPFRAALNPRFGDLRKARYTFHIAADVTDLNGETHSETSTVYAGYEPLSISAIVPNESDAASFRKLYLRVFDLNNRVQHARVTLTATRLEAPGRLLRNRYWQQPDQFVMSREEYIRLFPHDVYADEDRKETWPRGSAVQLFDGVPDKEGIEWSGKPLLPGYYLLTAKAKDSAGNETVLEKYTELQAEGLPAARGYLWVNAPAAAYATGDTVRLVVGSSVPAVVFEKRTTALNDSLPLRMFATNPTSGHISWIVRPEDRGGSNFSWLTVRDNRIWQRNASVSVPWWYDKTLQLSFGTYRNHALPGSPEKWTVTVRGLRGEKVAAELLASMYDASLDQLQQHYWDTPNIWPNASIPDKWNGPGFRSSTATATRTDGYYRNWKLLPEAPALIFKQGLAGIVGNTRIRGTNLAKGPSAQFDMNDVVVSGYALQRQSKEVAFSTSKVIMGKAAGLLIQTLPQDSVISEQVQSQGNAPVIRRDFRETAFFYPDLRTDSNGTVTFAFNYPEAVTTWKLRALALTKDLSFGLKAAELITQKPLMVQPNLPRFLRQGDHFEIVSKVVNLTGNELTGQAQLELFDPATGKPVDGWFQNSFPNQYFTVAANGTETVAFPVEVPYLYNSALTWRITARAGDFSDAEEATLPVLSSKVLVTETLPLPMRGNGTKTFAFEKLLRSGESETLQPQGLTLEFTANPAWSVVQALPYLMEYPYECAEQTWNRYYANAVAAHILQRAPRIRAIFERWKNVDTAALQSALEKNPELKSALLEETPWVLQAENDSRQRQNIALLFDLTQRAAAQAGTLQKLKDLQKSDGSFPWFDDGPSDRYITTYILAGIGHLQELGVDVSPLAGIRERAMNYADMQLARDYASLKNGKTKWPDATPNSLQVLHLYARSFTHARPADSLKAAFNYYLARLEKTWLSASRRSQGMTALTLQRYGNKPIAAAILQSLRETAIHSEELGMYWKDVHYGRSWYWYDAPIETQALLIEAFSEIASDTATANELRTWLLKNKQVNNWRTTTATADACYALLLRGSNWLATTPRVLLQAGPVQVSSDTAAEAGSGYFKKVIPGALVSPEMGRITVQVQGDSSRTQAPAWGAAYWQYFEEMDKVTSAATPLSIERRIYRVDNSSKEMKLIPVESSMDLHVGDKVRVRLLVRSDRAMEYVHLKDLRPSCLEPVDVHSGYEWQGNVGYYKSTRDVSTNFFLQLLPAGTHVFEYTLFVTHKGDFSAGMASLQCLYAPEFSAHSEGKRLGVD